MHAFCLPITVALLVSTAPAFAAVNVISPANGATVTSPLTLTATTTPCSSQTVGTMGYSFDNGATTLIAGIAIGAPIAAPLGVHVLHVKSWGTQGSVCVTNVTINVQAAAAAASPLTTPVTNVVVTSPANGATLASPFSLSASGTQCSSQTITAFGYSLDSSANTTFFTGSTMAASVTAATGAHILHVKSWSNQGAACDTDLAITVAPPAPVISGPTIPANAVAVKAIQNLAWTAEFDAGTILGTGATSGASSSGVTNPVPAPALSGSARQFVTSYANYGGERYYAKIGADTTATNFVYDTYVYLAAPINDIANIEMDMNQVMANGQTVIFGFQCDGWSRTWDYTANTGTPTSFIDQWLHTTQPCNPQAWSTNTWHHVQVSYSRDNSGNVTYKSVWLDGVEQDVNVTANSTFALGWGSSLITNLQIDGMTGLPGTATVYLDNLTIYRW